MDHAERKIDKWLKWAAIFGPLFGFVFGVCAGSVASYQAFKDDNRRISMMEGWKEKQEDFNRSTVSAISALQAIVQRIK